MADNYLEKKFEEMNARGASKKTSRLAAHAAPRFTNLNSLLLKNRSFRGFDPSREVTRDDLLQIVGVNDKVPSARNQQVLRFKLVTPADAPKMHPLIKLGGALPQLHLPLPGTEPSAYIVICSTVPENKWVDMDLGIAAQSMLLQAVSMGLNGICIGAFDKNEVTETFKLPYEPVLVIAFGKGTEKIQITHIHPQDDHKYYRVDGLHLVPKIPAAELLID